MQTFVVTAPLLLFSFTDQNQQVRVWLLILVFLNNDENVTSRRELLIRRSWIAHGSVYHLHRNSKTIQSIIYEMFTTYVFLDWCAKNTSKRVMVFVWFGCKLRSFIRSLVAHTHTHTHTHTHSFLSSQRKRETFL